MTAYSLTDGIPRQSATLCRQRVGGCSAKTTASAFLVAAMLVGASLFYVWSRTEILRQGYAFTQTAEEIKSLKAEQDRLRVELVQLQSPERIGQIAQEQLGLQFPDPSQLRVVGPTDHQQLGEQPSGEKPRGGGEVTPAKR
jgi:cell division protein FtsL